MAALSLCSAAWAGRPATGVVGFADSWMGADPRWGFYEVPTEGAPEELPLIMASEYTRCGLGGVYFDGKFMGIFDSSDYGQQSVSYYVSDIASGAVKEMGQLPANFQAYSLVYDPDQRVAYGSFAETDSGKTWFGTLDPSTGELTAIREFTSATAWFGMGMTEDGQLYGIDKTGVFYKIDKANGNYSIVKITKIATTYLTSGSVSPEDGQFYYATSLDAGSALYRIDPSTGASEKLYDLPDNEEIRALFFPQDVDFLQAPDAPTSLSVDFPEGSLSGYFRFTMPSLLADGGAAPSSMPYLVTLDGEPYATGDAAPGQKVDVAVEVETAGIHSFTVRAYNGERAGEVANGEFFIGPVQAYDPPYMQTFSTQEEADQMMIINANGDAHTWEWDKRGYMGYYYSFTENADDYLVLPALRLEAGKSYGFSFSAYRWEGRYPAETVAAYVGTEPAASAFTECIIPPTDIDNTVPETLSSTFTPAEDGLYYFAIKAMSKANSFALYVDDISVTAPMVSSSPAAPTDLTAIPDQAGALAATIIFTAPDKTMDGEPLEYISKAEIYRGGDLIATLDAEPGMTVEYIDTEAASGYNSYSAVCYDNAGGAGDRATVTVFVGHSLPVAPENIIVREGNQDEITVSWDRVERDQNGLTIAPGQVTYTVTSVINGHQEVVAEDLVDNSVVFNLYSEDGEQEFLQFIIYAVNSVGVGPRGVSQPFAYGDAYKLPFEESFANGAVMHAITTVSDGAVWWSATDADYEGDVSAQDGDNGYAVMSSSSLEDGAWLYTGVIDLTEAETPMLSFYFFSVKGDDENTLQVIGSDANTNEYKPLSPVLSLGGRESRGWYEVEVPLTEFAGKKMQLGFEGWILKYGVIMIDNIRVYDEGSGVEIPVADSQDSFFVKVADGIVASEKVSVFDASGRKVAAGSGHIRLNPGIYVVKGAEKVMKIAL